MVRLSASAMAARAWKDQKEHNVTSKKAEDDEEEEEEDEQEMELVYEEPQLRLDEADMLQVFRAFEARVPKVFYADQYETSESYEAKDAEEHDVSGQEPRTGIKEATEALETTDGALPLEQLSRKRAKRLGRMNVAQLKSLAPRPEVVEWDDVNSRDAVLLVHLKAVKNSMAVPVHWAQKRKYLQGKRGIEKPPFELPAYIRATGVTEQRDTAVNQEAERSLKARTRERLQGRLGKLNLDYEKLHDAFFKFQTKPRLTKYGDLYYEGKEFETKVFHKKAGYLSEELRDALGMTSRLAPPPWLLNQQRVGPPPSYPWLKIPGLNAPLPDGAVWGYQPGGWGKAPVDDFNRPLYGDVFGTAGSAQPDVARQLLDSIDRTLWGEAMVNDEGLVLADALLDEGSPDQQALEDDEE